MRLLDMIVAYLLALYLLGLLLYFENWTAGAAAADVLGILVLTGSVQCGIDDLMQVD